MGQKSYQPTVQFKANLEILKVQTIFMSPVQSPFGDMIAESMWEKKFWSVCPFQVLEGGPIQNRIQRGKLPIIHFMLLTRSERPSIARSTVQNVTIWRLVIVYILLTDLIPSPLGPTVHTDPFHDRSLFQKFNGMQQCNMKKETLHMLWMLAHVWSLAQ